MKIITINVQKALMEKIDWYSANRSDFIRKAISEFLESDEWHRFSGGNQISTVNMEKKDIEILNKMVECGIFPSRSEIARFAIYMKIRKLEDEEKKAEEEKRLRVLWNPETGIIQIPTADVYKTYKIIPK